MQMRKVLVGAIILAFILPSLIMMQHLLQGDIVLDGNRVLRDGLSNYKEKKVLLRDVEIISHTTYDFASNSPENGWDVWLIRLADGAYARVFSKSKYVPEMRPGEKRSMFVKVKPYQDYTMNVSSADFRQDEADPEKDRFLDQTLEYCPILSRFIF